jgi:hypothetical protein
VVGSRPFKRSAERADLPAALSFYADVCWQQAEIETAESSRGRCVVLRHRLGAGALLASLISCSADGGRNEVAAPAVDLHATLKSAPGAAERRRSKTEGVKKQADAAAQAGMFRWSSGFRMDTFWASVSNRNGDWLRFFAEETSDSGSILWSPTIEIKNAALKRSIKGGEVVNFVVGEAAIVLSYTIDENGLVAINDFGTDTTKILDALHNTREKVFCVEFPGADYRTCFSTSGMQAALFPE